jgi:hypothetical protein
MLVGVSYTYRNSVLSMSGPLGWNGPSLENAVGNEADDKAKWEKLTTKKLDRQGVKRPRSSIIPTTVTRSQWCCRRRSRPSYLGIRKERMTKTGNSRRSSFAKVRGDAGKIRGNCGEGDEKLANHLSQPLEFFVPFILPSTSGGGVRKGG